MKQSMSRMIGSVLVIVAGLSIPLTAQNQGGFQGGGGGFQGQGGRGIDPQQIQQAQNDMIRDALGASDQEWAVLGPKIQNIQQLQNASGGGMAGSINSMMRMARQMARNNQNGQGNNQGGFGNNQNGGRGQIPNIAQMLGIKDSVMSQRMQELQTMLENPDTPDNQIKQKLDSVREARDRARAQLDQARKDLIDLLTTRQEAILFGLGILE